MAAPGALLLLLLLASLGSSTLDPQVATEQLQPPAWLEPRWCAAADVDCGAEASSGWQPPPAGHRSLYSHGCSIPRISAAAWRQRVSRGEVLDSVVIEGAADNAEFRALTRREELLRRYGHTTVLLSSANTFSYAKREVGG